MFRIEIPNGNFPRLRQQTFRCISLDATHFHVFSSLPLLRLNPIMATHPTYHLRVSAGSSYAQSTHNLVPVNTSEPLHISSSFLSADLSLRIASYRGLPTSSPSTSPYFSHPSHVSDRYSIGFSFTPTHDIPGDELVFGNDFEHPVRDRLPPGFNAALRLVKWAIDPGLDGDVYADEPFLYGPLLSSINVLRIGRKSDGGKTGKGKGHEEQEDGDEEDEEDDGVITESADGEDAEEIRQRLHIPAEGPKRMKHFLTEAHKKAFTFEAGRRYQCDFFNGYLDFNGKFVPPCRLRSWQNAPLS